MFSSARAVMNIFFILGYGPFFGIRMSEWYRYIEVVIFVVFTV